MTTTSGAAGSPFEFVIREKSYLLSPLLDIDLGTLEKWVQDRHVDLVKRNCDGMNESDRRYHVDKAFDVASLITINSPQSIEILSTPEGSIMMLWLSMRRNHPEMTKEEVSLLCENREELEEACKKIVGKTKVKAPKKKQTARRKPTRKKGRH